MTDDATRSDPFADVINLLAAPIASGIRTVEQYRRGVDELFRAVENLNRTLENLNDTAERVNRLLADVEEPVRAMIPQLTRTVRTADELTRRLEAPVRAAAPNLEQIVTTLSSPGFATLPAQLSDFVQIVGDVSRRLGPLTQLAEGAGGLLGGLRLPGMGRPATSTPDAAPPIVDRARSDDDSTSTGPAQDTPRASKKAGAEKSTGKKAAGKKPTKKATGKKAAAKKSAKKATGKQAAAKKSGKKATGKQAAASTTAGTKAARTRSWSSVASPTSEHG